MPTEAEYHISDPSPSREPQRLSRVGSVTHSADEEIETSELGSSKSHGE